MLIKKPDEIKSSEITDKQLYLNRRNFLRGAVLAGTTTATGLLYRKLTSTMGQTAIVEETPITGGEHWTPRSDITTYNNFYEFSTSKRGVAGAAKNFMTRPWTVAVEGLVHKPKVFNVDELIKLFPAEERLRCVEGWSMVIPWLGFPLAGLLKQVEPTSQAKYVQFVTLHDPQVLQPSGSGAGHSQAAFHRGWDAGLLHYGSAGDHFDEQNDQTPRREKMEPAASGSLCRSGGRRAALLATCQGRYTDSAGVCRGAGRAARLSAAQQIRAATDGENSNENKGNSAMMNQRTIRRISKNLCWSLLLAAMMLTTTVAQDQPLAAKSDSPVISTYKVSHDHAIGKGKGELRITDTGIEFKGEGKDEERHNRNWRDDDIKRLSISRDELSVTVYEASRIPIVPRKAPFTGGKSIGAGTEHDYVFRLREGEIKPEIVSALLARFNRPIETSVLPNDEAESGRLLFEIPVFHRQRAGGKSGILRVYEQHVVFSADADGDARFWRYADIRDIGQFGRYRFEIATYEGQVGVDGKSYIFDLKRPMTEVEYESLWAKVYERGRNTGLRPALSDH